MTRPTSPPGSPRSIAFAAAPADEGADDDEHVVDGVGADRIDARRPRFDLTPAAPARPDVMPFDSEGATGIGATAGAKRPHQTASLCKAATSATGFHASTIGSGAATHGRSLRRRLKSDAFETDVAAARRTRANFTSPAECEGSSACSEGAADRLVACDAEDRADARHDSDGTSRGGRSRASGEARADGARPQSRRIASASRHGEPSPFEAISRPFADSSSMRASARSRPGRTPCRQAVEQARQMSFRPATSRTRSTGGTTIASARFGGSVVFERSTLRAASACEGA